MASFPKIPQVQVARRPPRIRTISTDETKWLQNLKEWYPDLDKKTHFIPPLHFNTVPYNIQTVAGQTVLVPALSGEKYVHPSPELDPPVASRVWLDVPKPTDPLQKVHDVDVKEDRAWQRVLRYIESVSRNNREVMMVISKLDFRKDLDNQVDPIINANRQCRLFKKRGWNDQSCELVLLIVSRSYGLIVCEVNAVGEDSNTVRSRAETGRALVTTVQKMVKQLNSKEWLLRQLVQDREPVPISKTLMLPNVTSQQLLAALDTDRNVSRSLCDSMGVPDVAMAAGMCLCADHLKSDAWWKQAITANGPNINMTQTLYEVLAARFCGPATTVDIPASPCATFAYRNLGEAVAETGHRMARITLYPDQVVLVNRRGARKVFLTGPPGTGKTIVLNVKCMQWLHRGKHVHVVSTWERSIAASYLIQDQLSRVASSEKVHHHMYDLQKKDDLDKAVSTLTSAALNGELYVIADEAGPDDGPFFQDFCTRLTNQNIPGLRLWAASVRHRRIPSCMEREILRIPLRCPPTVVREVAKADEFQQQEVLRYIQCPVPLPTEGPTVLWKYHHGQPAHDRMSDPESCTACGETIYDVLRELHVGPDGALRYRDVLILCSRLHENIQIVKYLRTMGIPVEVISNTNKKEAIRDVALARKDAVTVAYTYTIFGLERRVVFWIGPVKDGRLDAMSRCTAQLIVIGKDKRPRAEQDDDVGSWSDESDCSNDAKFSSFISHSDSESSFSDGDWSDVHDLVSSSDESDCSKDAGYSSSISRSASESSFSDVQQSDDEDIHTDNYTANNLGTTMQLPTLAADGEESLSDARPSEVCRDLGEEGAGAAVNVPHEPPPVFAEDWQVTETFFHEGGQLQAEDSDVILYVPEGAVTERDGVTIHGSVSTDLKAAQSRLELSAETAIVSPVVEFSAGHVRFHKPVLVLLPCFFSDPTKICVYRVHHDDNGMHIDTLAPSRGKEVCQPADSEYIVNAELKQVHIFTYHFSEFLCTECHTQQKTPSLYMELYGVHEQRTNRDVDLKLFIWDNRWKIRDFRKPWLPDKEEEKNLLAHQTLNPLQLPEPAHDSQPAQGVTDMAVRMHLQLEDKDHQTWKFKEFKGKAWQTPEQTAELQRFMSCCQEPKPVRTNWNLQNRPGVTPDAWFECSIEVGYVTKMRNNLVFITEPSPVLLTVTGLKVRNERNVAGTQTEGQMEGVSHVGQLEEPSGHRQARSVKPEGAGASLTAARGGNDRILKNPEQCSEVCGSREMIVHDGPERQAVQIQAPQTIHVLKVDVESDAHRRFESVARGFTTDLYAMRQAPRGVCLIINNVSFEAARRNGHTQMEDRTGSDVDVRSLETLFSQLGFSVEKEADCTADRLTSELTERLQRDHTHYDCFVCVILTHGHHGVLLGVDGMPVSLNALTYDLVTQTMHTSLAGKPKLFFFQACQGGGLGPAPDTPAGSGASPAAVLSPQAGGEVPRDTRSSHPSPGPAGRATGAFTDRSLPSDISVAIATCPGYTAIRDRSLGTLFVQELVKVFAQHACESDLADLMTKVNARVARVYYPDVNHRQQPEFKSTLNKKLYFFPGLVSSRS